MQAAEKGQNQIAASVKRRTRENMLSGEVGEKVGAELKRYTTGKYFKREIADGQFRFSRDREILRREEDLDGIYVGRDGKENNNLPAQDVETSVLLFPCFFGAGSLD